MPIVINRAKARYPHGADIAERHVEFPHTEVIKAPIKLAGPIVGSADELRDANLAIQSLKPDVGIDIPVALPEAFLDRIGREEHIRSELRLDPIGLNNLDRRRFLCL